MSDVNLLQSLLQLAHHDALQTDRAMQMQLLRYWDDELAKPRNADPKRLLRHATKTESFKRYSGGSETETGFSSSSASRPELNAIPPSF
jgi:hypothetical protein